VVASFTTLPVIGVPLAATPLAGFDSLMSIVQMPPGIPVATVAVGDMGARNAGHLAAQIIAVADPAVAAAVTRQRQDMRSAIQLPDGFTLPA
jgi:phosphoribosylaminoimidazole carboxylase PurE protein